MLGELWRRLRDEWWSPDMAFGGDGFAAYSGVKTPSAPAGVADWAGAGGLTHALVSTFGCNATCFCGMNYHLLWDEFGGVSVTRTAKVVLKSGGPAWGC